MNYGSDSMKNTSSKQLKNNQGFTVIELLITLLVVSVVISIGLPSFKGTIQNARLTSQINHMIGVIAFARNEAAKRPNTNITLCATNNPNASTPACNTNTWETSYLVFADGNGDSVINNVSEDANGNGILDLGEDINGNGTLDTVADQILQIGRTLEGGNTLRTRGFPSTNVINFNARGEPNSGGSFMLCDERGLTSAKGIVVSVIGHVRIAADQDADGIVNVDNGANILCP